MSIKPMGNNTGDNKDRYFIGPSRTYIILLFIHMVKLIIHMAKTKLIRPAKTRRVMALLS